MKVNSIQSNNYQKINTPKFGTLNITEGGQKTLSSLWGNAEMLQRIDVWKKQLANTKYFDLEIDKYRKYRYGGLFMKICSKNNLHPSCEAPLRVGKKNNGNWLDVAGTELIYDVGYVYYPLRFASEKDAENAFKTLYEYQYGKNNYPAHIVAWAVDSVKILDKAYEYSENSKNNLREILSLPPI